jgi:hypothetical protein
MKEIKYIFWTAAYVGLLISGLLSMLNKEYDRAEMEFILALIVRPTYNTKTK